MADTDMVAQDWQPPTAAAIAVTGERLNLGLTRDDIALCRAFAPVSRDAHDRLARLVAARRPTPPADRTWRLPAAGDNPLNAWQVRCALPATSSGVLDGLRLAVKSTIGMAGLPLDAGSRLLHGHISPRDATVVTRALAHGARIVGSGRTDDLCLAITGDQPADGPVLNPWNRGYSTWGSSAGAAAVVANGEADAAILVDQAGSARMPGAGCGLLVWLPTRGMIPMTGILAFTPIQDRVGVAGLDTATVAALGRALAGRDGVDLLQGPAAPATPTPWTGPGQAGAWWSTSTPPAGDVASLRVGLIAESLAPELCDPQIAALVRRQCMLLRRAGATVREVHIDQYATTAVDTAMLLTVHEGVAHLLATNLGASPTAGAGDPGLVAHIAARRRTRPQSLAATAKISAGVFADDGGYPAGYWAEVAHAAVAEVADSHSRAFDGVDVLVSPTAHATAPLLPGPSMTRGEVLARALGPGIIHTCRWNLTGHPAVQIPAGLADGLPAGLQVVARHGHDATLLRVAAALQPAGGWPTAC